MPGAGGKRRKTKGGGKLKQTHENRNRKNKNRRIIQQQQQAQLRATQPPVKVLVQLLELIRELKAELCRREAEAAGSWQQRFDAGELWVDWDADFMLVLRDGVPRPASHNEFHCISCGDHVQLRFGASAGMVAARLYLCQPCDEHVVPPPIREWNLWVSTRGRLGTGYGVEALREWWQQVLDATDDGEAAE